MHRTQVNFPPGRLLTSCCAFTDTVGATGLEPMPALTDEAGQSSGVTLITKPELTNGTKAVMGTALLEMLPLVILQNRDVLGLVARGIVEMIFQGAG